MHLRPSATALLTLAVSVSLLTGGCSVPTGGTDGGPDVPIPSPGGGPASPVEVPTALAAQPTPSGSYLPPTADFPTPHPAFRKHFTDPLYYDEGEEFSPFGSDEGWDTLYLWVEQRNQLTDCSTVQQLYESAYDEGTFADADQNGPDVDGFMIGSGFALILLTGRIDPAGKEATLAALHRTYSFYAASRPREPAVMIRDLESFPATRCPGTSATPVV